MAKGLSRKEIEEGLRELGLVEGDVVLLHSSLASFGHVDGGAPTVVEAFLAVLGQDGTLVVPAFGSFGAIADVVRQSSEAVHSLHPLASVAAIGADADYICQDHWKAETAHGKDTPYMRVAELGGYVCLAGVDQDRNTSLHTAEALLELPYLSERTATFDTPEGQVTQTWKHFPGPHRDFIALDRLLRERGVMRRGRIGASVVRLMKSQKMLDVCIEAGTADPTFVLCDNPQCADCVAQRTAIRRDRLAREDFTLVAASGLAGRHVDEVIANVKRAGLGSVELDYLDGKPVYAFSIDELRMAVKRLRDAGCTVTAMRCWAVPDNVEEFMDGVAVTGVRRVVMPLSPAAKKLVKLASDRGLRLSVFNLAQDSSTVTRMLEKLREAGPKVGLTFSVGEFARIGEKPFLGSFKKRLRKVIDQLDVEDRTFDGVVQPLARGNAEIKEMISILRCRSFDGPMVLTSTNREWGDLMAVVLRFEHLLDAM